MATPVIRTFSLVGNTLTQENSIPLAGSRSGFARSGETVWLLGLTDVPMMHWGRPFNLAPILSGWVSIYNGSSFSSAVPGIEHVPSAVTWDVSGTVWAATTENDLYHISIGGAVLSHSVIPPYGAQTVGTPLGVSALTWMGGNLYAASSLNGLLIKVL